MMHIILSILLYLNIISSPGTYTLSEIRKDVADNKTKIEAVKSDPTLLQNVIATYKTTVSSISVLDDGQLK